MSVRIYMFKDLCTVTGYDLILTNDECRVAHFINHSSDGTKECGINKCERVIHVGSFATFDYNDRRLPLIIKPTENEIVTKLSMDNVKVIGTEISSTCLPYLFCSICGNKDYLTSFKMTKNGCVICQNCQKNYHNILTNLGNVNLTSHNFVYLDTQIGWFNHKSYQNKTKIWIKE